MKEKRTKVREGFCRLKRERRWKKLLWDRNGQCKLINQLAAMQSLMRLAVWFVSDGQYKVSKKWKRYVWEGRWKDKCSSQDRWIVYLKIVFICTIKICEGLTADHLGSCLQFS